MKHSSYPFAIYSLQSGKQCLQLFDCDAVTGQDAKELYQLILKEGKKEFSIQKNSMRLSLLKVHLHLYIVWMYLL